MVPFFGSGDGTFPLNSDEPEFVTGPDPRAVAIGDFTGDGIPDLITAGQTLDVFRGHGDGWFDDAFSYSANGSMHTSVAAADFNGDGNLDVVTSDADTGTVSLLLGNGSGVLTYMGAFAAGTSPSAVTVGDFNGDCRLDVAVANGGSNNLSVLINDGNWGTVPPPPPTLSIGDTTITEGDSGTLNATFRVALTQPAAVDVTVHYETANITATQLTDYTFTSGTLTIPAGQTSQTFTVAIKGDRISEPTETFAVRLSNPTNAPIADGEEIGTILDNDQVPTIVINNVTRAEGNSATTQFSFTVSLSSASDQPLQVNYATANGSASSSGGNRDYEGSSGTLIFPAGVTSRTVTVFVVGDKRSELDEIFYLSQPMAVAIADGQGVGTILNDDLSGGKQQKALPTRGGNSFLSITRGSSGIAGTESLVTIARASVTLPSTASLSKVNPSIRAMPALVSLGNQVGHTCSASDMRTSKRAQIRSAKLLLEPIFSNTRQRLQD